MKKRIKSSSKNLKLIIFLITLTSMMIISSICVSAQMSQIDNVNPYDAQQVVKDGVGNIYIVYNKNINGYPHIHVKKSTDGGVSWNYWNGTNFVGGTETPIESNGNYLQRNPKIIADNNNNIHVVWYGNATSSPSYFQIWHSKYNGTSWSSPINITSGNYDQRNPEISIDSINNIHAVWHGTSSTSTSKTQIRYSKYNGTSWSSPIDITNSGTDQWYPYIKIDSTNNIHVYMASMNTNSTIEIRYLKYNGISWSSPVNITNTGNYNQSSPNMEIDSNNNIHMVWVGKSATSSSYDQVRYSKSTNGGTSWSNPVDLTSGNYNQISPKITIDSNNNIHMIWVGKSTTSPSYDQVRYINSTNGGTSWSSLVDLTSGNYAQQNTSHILKDSNNNLHLLWNGVSATSPSYNQIRYSKSTNGGTSWSSPTNITSGNNSMTNLDNPNSEEIYTFNGTTNSSGVSSSGNGIMFATVPDTTAPTAAITYSTTGPYKQGANVTITATFNEAMNTSPVPQISISGVNTLAATNMTRTDATHYTYAYTVGAGNGTATIALSTGQDLAGNVITSTPTSGSTFTVDNTAPTAAITYSATGPYKSGDSVTITATFSEAMNTSPVPQISISGVNTLAATNMTKVDSTHYTYAYTVGAGNGTATIALSVGQDLAGNVITSAPTSGSTFTVDNTAPTAAITYSPAGPYRQDNVITITATFSEAMNTSPVPQISINGVNTLAATNMTRTDGTHYTYAYTVGLGNGDGTIALSTGQDLAGNVITSVPTSGSTFTVDNLLPTTTVSTPLAQDISNNDSAQDIKVTFTAPTNELKISSYKIFVVPSANVATFNQSAANSNVNGQTENKGSIKTHSVVLNSTTKDSTGAAIQNGKTYKIFVNVIAKEGYANKISSGSSDLTLVGPVTVKTSNMPIVSDIANNGDGSDIRVSFKGLVSEANISGYKIFVVPSANIFPLASATGALNSYGYDVAKAGDGAKYLVTLTSGQKTTANVLIGNGVAYKVYVLAIGANGYSSSLSSPSQSITLSATVPATTAVAISKVEDVNNTGNASDIKVTFKGVKDETKISGYKIFVVVKDAGLTLTAATTAPVNARGHAVVKKGSGKTYAITIDAGITNSAGGAITSTGAYDIYVLATGTGNYSSSLSAKKTITLSAAVPRLVTGTSVQVSQRTHAGNASDIKGTFTAPEETNIASYQVYIVKAANAVTFAGTAIATITNNANHEDVVTTGKGKLHTVIFDAARLDSDGDAIVNGTGYKVFVLSVGKNNYINSLSAGSRSIILN